MEVSVGVPVIAPVEALKVRPAGRDGEIAYIRGDDPPEPITGMNDIEATVWARVLVATAWVATRGPRMSISVVCELIALFESETVMT